MGLVYGSGFKPIGVENVGREKTSAAETALFTFLRVALAVAFIAASFIPIAGEAIEAPILAAEGAIEGALEGAAELTIESAASASVESSLSVGSSISRTARTLRLGDTIKGSVGLGLGEAVGNEMIDRLEGVEGTVNTVINFGLAFTPLIGKFKSSRTNQIRFIKTIEKQIEEQRSLLRIVTNPEDKIAIELRIKQLENAKLVRSSNMFGVNINSATTSIAENEAIKIVDDAVKTNKNVYVNKVARQLKKELSTQSIKLSKTEARLIVKGLAKKLPDIKEGVTVKGIIDSRHFNRSVNLMRYLDPNLAARKVWTGLARKVTSNEALIQYQTKAGNKEIGKWFKKINIGYYKRFGKKVSSWWRKWGAKVYKHSRVRMIPVTSKWIEGIRLVPTGAPAVYIMIVIFKPSKNGRIPPPVLVNPTSLEFAMKFVAGEGFGGSVGSFYINRIALARNGSGPSVTGSLASILGPLSLGTLRKALSAPAALERLIRRFSKGDYFETWIDNVKETSNRLVPHKIGKVIAGRWGIALARGFQQTHKGHTTIFDTKFRWNYLIEELGIVTLDKARAVQRKAGIKGRTSIINGRRVVNQYQRTVKLMTFGYVKFDGKKGLKMGKGIF